MNELIVKKIKKEIEENISIGNKLRASRIESDLQLLKRTSMRITVLKNVLLLAESSISLDFVLESKAKLIEKQNKIIDSANNYAKHLAFLNEDEKEIAREKFIKNTNFSKITNNIKNIDLLLSFA